MKIVSGHFKLDSDTFEEMPSMTAYTKRKEKKNKGYNIFLNNERKRRVVESISSSRNVVHTLAGEILLGRRHNDA